MHLPSIFSTQFIKFLRSIPNLKFDFSISSFSWFSLLLRRLLALFSNTFNFLHSPPPSKPLITPDSSDEEIKGTEVPPEKVPRQVLAGKKPSLFASIQHKFARPDNTKNPSSDYRFEEDINSNALCVSLGFDRAADIDNDNLKTKQLNQMKVNASKHLFLSSLTPRGLFEELWSLVNIHSMETGMAGAVNTEHLVPTVVDVNTGSENSFLMLTMTFHSAWNTSLYPIIKFGVVVSQF